MADKNTRKVLKSVLVHRDGKPFYPPVGKGFKFTDDELEDIKRLNPSAVQAAADEDELEVVDPPVQTEAEREAAAKAAAKAAKAAEAAAKTAGNKTADDDL